MMFDAIALGESLIDFATVSVDGDGYPTMAAHPGGAPVNFLAALSGYGAKTAMIGKVGDDAFGKLLLSTMEHAGICTKGMVKDPSVFTTLAFVTIGENGARDFSFSRKPGADTQLRAEEIDLSLLKDCRLFHFGTLSLTDEPAGEATEKAIVFARENGALISCDPNLRKPLWKDLDQAKEKMLWSISQSDIVKISDDEVFFLWGINAEEAAEKIIREFGVKLVYVTCGAEGAYFANGHAWGHVGAAKGIHAVDTTGAGDIFGGSAAWKFLSMNTAPEDLSEPQMREIVSFASVAAGLSTEKYGGIPSVPSMEEIISRNGKTFFQNEI